MLTSTAVTIYALIAVPNAYADGIEGLGVIPHTDKTWKSELIID